MTSTIYKGVEIRQYGTERGEGVYPLAFTDNLDDENRGPVVHDCMFDAKEYIDDRV